MYIKKNLCNISDAQNLEECKTNYIETQENEP